MRLFGKDGIRFAHKFEIIDVEPKVAVVVAQHLYGQFVSEFCLDTSRVTGLRLAVRKCLLALGRSTPDSSWRRSHVARLAHGYGRAVAPSFVLLF